MAAARANDAPFWPRGRIAALWTGLTARERLLVVVMGLIVLAGTAFSSADWSANQRDRYAAAQADLALARQARLASRGVLDIATRARLTRLSDWTPTSRNIWMARLDLEQALAAAAEQAGLPDPEIRVAEGVEGDPALPLVRVEIDGPYVAEPFNGFLRRLADDRRAFVVGRLRIDNAETARYRLELLFPVTLPPGGGA